MSFYNGYDYDAKSIISEYSTENQRITRKRQQNDLKIKHLAPTKFIERWQEANFKNINKFSEHDNHNAIQHFGEYFDSGYGKRQINSNFYHTDPDHLSHYPNGDSNKYQTITRFHYQGTQSNDNSQKWYRKYPKSHVQPSDTKSRTNSSLSATSIHTIPQFIKEQQSQRLIYGPWKFSFKKENTVYPNLKLNTNKNRKLMIDLSKY